MSVIYHDALLNGELNRTLYEEVINHFLKVCHSLSLDSVTDCVHSKYWSYTFAEE